MVDVIVDHIESPPKKVLIPFTYQHRDMCRSLLTTSSASSSPTYPTSPPRPKRPLSSSWSSPHLHLRIERRRLTSTMTPTSHRSDNCRVSEECPLLDPSTGPGSTAKRTSDNILPPHAVSSRNSRYSFSPPSDRPPQSYGDHVHQYHPVTPSKTFPPTNHPSPSRPFNTRGKRQNLFGARMPMIRIHPQYQLQNQAIGKVHLLHGNQPSTDCKDVSQHHIHHQFHQSANRPWTSNEFVPRAGQSAASLPQAKPSQTKP